MYLFHYSCPVFIIAIPLLVLQNYHVLVEAVLVLVFAQGIVTGVVGVRQIEAGEGLMLKLEKKKEK